jgi:hypothetical protein
MNAEQRSLFRRITDVVYRDDCEMIEALAVVIHITVSLARALHVPLTVLQQGVTKAYDMPKEDLPK